MSRRGSVTFDDEYKIANQCIASKLALTAYYNKSIAVRRGMKPTDFYQQLLEQFSKQTNPFGILTAFESDPFSFIFAYKHKESIILIDPTGRLRKSHIPDTYTRKVYIAEEPLYWRDQRTILNSPSKLTSESGKICLLLTNIFSDLANAKQLEPCLKLKDDKLDIKTFLQHAKPNLPRLDKTIASLVLSCGTYTYEQNKHYDSCLNNLNQFIEAKETTSKAHETTPDDQMKPSGKRTSKAAALFPQATPLAKAAKVTSTKHLTTLAEYINALYKQVTGKDAPEEKCQSLMKACRLFFSEHPLKVDHLLKMINYHDLRKTQLGDFHNWEKLFNKPQNTQTLWRKEDESKSWCNVLTNAMDLHFIKGNAPGADTSQLPKLITIGIDARCNFINHHELSVGLMIPIEAILRTIATIPEEDAKRQYRLYGPGGLSHGTQIFCALHTQVRRLLISKIKQGDIKLPPNDLSLHSIKVICDDWSTKLHEIETQITHKRQKDQETIARLESNFRQAP